MANEAVAPLLAEMRQLISISPTAIRRVGLALYDPELKRLTSFLHVTGIDQHHCNLHVSLDEIRCLQALAAQRQIRIIPDLKRLTVAGENTSASELLINGCHSCATAPLFDDEEFLGLLFIEANSPNVLCDKYKDFIHHAASATRQCLVRILEPVATLRERTELLRSLSGATDAEPADHLARMARYCRCLAEAVADQYRLDPVAIELIYRFAPLHDIGKLAVSHDLLAKPGPLAAEQLASVQEHVSKGVEIIDSLAHAFGLTSLPRREILHGIITGHHERWDGTGYPYGLGGDEIPVEARIAAVADVLDTITSPRPYNRPCSLYEARDYLHDHAGSQFDPMIVNAALQKWPEINTIRESLPVR